MFSKVASILLVLLHRVATRSVVFNYNSHVDTMEENINTFIEDTEHLDDGVRLFLEGVKHEIVTGREVIRPRQTNINEENSRSLRIFQRFVSHYEDGEEDTQDEVEILKTWKLADMQ